MIIKQEELVRSRMKIAICSDIHLEFGDIDLKNTEKADLLIISGDLLIAEYLHQFPEDGSILEDTEQSFKRRKAFEFRAFIRRINEEFPKTIVIAGNHEFYHGKWERTLCTLRQEYLKYPNITFLEDEHIIINDIVFVGGTLWSDMNKLDPITISSIRYLMNDFKLIIHDGENFRKVSPEDAIIRHKRTLKYFSEIIKKNHDKKVVVVGHHSPSRQSIHQRYKNDFEMNGGYSSDLDNFILENPNIILWTHGHTHFPFDYMIGSTRVLCNPRGYHEREESAYNFKLKYLEI